MAGKARKPFSEKELLFLKRNVEILKKLDGKEISVKNAENIILLLEKIANNSYNKEVFAPGVKIIKTSKKIVLTLEDKSSSLGTNPCFDCKNFNNCLKVGKPEGIMLPFIEEAEIFYPPTLQMYEKTSSLQRDYTAVILCKNFAKDDREILSTKKKSQ